MENHKIGLTPGLESNIHLRIYSPCSIRVTKQNESLTLEAEERKAVKKEMTFQFETVNFPKETHFAFFLIVEKENETPKTYLIGEEIVPKVLEEREENEGKRKIVLREITIECDFLRLRLFGKGTLRFLIRHDYQFGDSAFVEYPFDYPVTLSFVLPDSTPKIGTKVALHPDVHPIYQQCRFQLRISESNPRKEADDGCRMITWEPETIKEVKNWFIGCVTNGSSIQKITWPNSDITKGEFEYRYQLRLISDSSTGTVNRWSPVTCSTTNHRDSCNPLVVTKPKLAEFSLTIKEIKQEREPFDPEEEILLPREKDPKWILFEFTPTIRVERLEPSVYLPIQVEYRYYVRSKSDLHNQTIAIADPFRFSINGTATPTHQVWCSVEELGEESCFTALLQFPEQLFLNQKQPPFVNVLWYDHEQTGTPWGDEIRQANNVQQGCTDIANGIGVACQASSIGDKHFALEWNDRFNPRELAKCLTIEKHPIHGRPYQVIVDDEIRYEGFTNEEGSVIAPIGKEEKYEVRFLKVEAPFKLSDKITDDTMADDDNLEKEPNDLEPRVLGKCLTIEKHPVPGRPFQVIVDNEVRHEGLTDEEGTIVAPIAKEEIYEIRFLKIESPVSPPGKKKKKKTIDNKAGKREESTNQNSEPETEKEQTTRILGTCLTIGNTPISDRFYQIIVADEIRHEGKTDEKGIITAPLEENEKFEIVFPRS